MYLSQVKKCTLAMLCALLLTNVGGLMSAQAASQSIAKSPNDKRIYKSKVLDNGLKVIVVQDPKAIKSAASIEINVGSNQEPDTYPGLAHFLEHMLFLGTAKYPDTDAFQTIIHNNGGEFNAYTGGDRTHYYFNIQSAQFKNTLDQFSEFFKAPLLAMDHMDRERKNVDSEFRMYINQDRWRMVDVNKETSNPKHPFSRFTVGNVDTLPSDKDALHKALTQFFETYYSSDRMTLALVGPQTTNELLSIATEYFSDIPQKTTPNLDPQPVFTDAQMGVDIKIKAQGNSRQLMLLFALPDFKQDFRLKPLHLLSQIMGYEGEGSLYANLKNKGWITALVSSTDTTTGDTQDLLQLVFYLTPMGLRNVDDITQETFNWINLIKQKGYPENFFDDIKAIHQLEFTYHERESETSLASGLAHQMQQYPIAEVITSQYLMDDVTFEQALPPLNKAIESLSPKSLRRFLLSPDIVGNRRSKWFMAEYSLEALPSQITRADKGSTHSQLKLPESNPYIPDNLETVTQDSVNHPQKPNLVVNQDSYKLWHLNDKAFTNPKTNILINLLNQSSMDSPRNQVQSALYAMLVLEQLKQKLYPAIMLGESIHIYSHARGVTIQLGGYSDKQSILLKALVQALRNYEVNAVDFDLLKERLTREIKNFDQLPLYQQAIKGLNTLYTEPNWHPIQLLEALAKVNANDIQKYKDQFVESCQIEMFVNGNYAIKDAKIIGKAVKDQFNLKEDSETIEALPRAVDIPQDSVFYKILTTSDKNHTFALHAQNKIEDEKNIAEAMILSKLLATPIYQKLRVEKQIGYALGAYMSLSGMTNGLSFFVQSPNVKPENIYEILESFLREFLADLSKMSNKDIKAIKAALVQELKDPPKTLDEQTIRFWSKIESGRLDFTLRFKVADAIEKVEVKDLVSYFERVLFSDQSAIVVTASKMTNQPLHWKKLADWQSLKELSEKSTDQEKDDS